MIKIRPILFGLCAAVLPLSAFAAPLTVPVDQARRLPFSGFAASVSPGNPTIADVNVIDEQTILVIGKKAGVTNLIVLDRAGRTLFNDQVFVAEGDQSTITISRGGTTATYACSPYCQQTGGSAPAATGAAVPAGGAQPQSVAPSPGK